MRYDPDKHHRRSVRLKGYDYKRAGSYFVTTCTFGKQALFGEVVGSEMILNEYGAIVEACWHDLPLHYLHLALDAMVVMPNHVHGIIVLMVSDVAGAGSKPAPTKRHGLPEIVRAFKTYSARRINCVRCTKGALVWQRNYYEHIIRNDRELHAIRRYIENNSIHWAEDPENPARKR